MPEQSPTIDCGHLWHAGQTQRPDLSGLPCSAASAASPAVASSDPKRSPSCGAAGVVSGGARGVLGDRRLEGAVVCGAVALGLVLSIWQRDLQPRPGILVPVGHLPDPLPQFSLILHIFRRSLHEPKSLFPRPGAGRPPPARSRPRPISAAARWANACITTRAIAASKGRARRGFRAELVRVTLRQAVSGPARYAEKAPAIRRALRGAVLLQHRPPGVWPAGWRLSGPEPWPDLWRDGTGREHVSARLSSGVDPGRNIEATLQGIGYRPTPDGTFASER